MWYTCICNSETLLHSNMYFNANHCHHHHHHRHRHVYRNRLLNTQLLRPGSALLEPAQNLITQNNRGVCVQKVLDGYDVFCRYTPVLQYCGPSVYTDSSCRDPVLLVACLAWCRLAGGAAAISQYMFSSDGAFAEFVTGAGESTLLLEVLRLRRITQHWTQQVVMKQHRRMQRKTDTIRSMRSCRSSSRVFRVSWSSRS